MQVIPLEIPDVKLIQPVVWEDERGYFFESYSKRVFAALGIDAEFVQDNQSLSFKNTLRGLHFQVPPWEQGKLVRVIKGRVLDVAVDIRKDSPYYGKHIMAELSDKNKLMLWIPPGFAHGFLTLDDENIFCYKCTQYYNRQAERVLLWNDPDLKIDWKTDSPLISERDKHGILFRDLHNLA